MVPSLRAFVASAFWLAATAQTENEDEEQAPIWFDNVEEMSNPDNFAMVPWAPLKDRYDDPDLFDSLEHGGYDWTQPFPGSKLDSGFVASLLVVDEIPLPAELGGFNETTAVSTIKHSIPETLMDGDVPKKMDASWTVCRHYFITTNVTDTQGDHECAFIPEQCREDLVKELTVDWLTEEQTACSRMTPDPIPESCWGDLGFSRQIMFRKASRPPRCT
ncbi:hypothetical protein IMZ48_35135 [Candidatus Bathyarchaeota archaeon]|nr:hypothetical protein [Candidatus Bathyarchaeota archaeon]